MPLQWVASNRLSFVCTGYTGAETLASCLWTSLHRSCSQCYHLENKIVLILLLTFYREREVEWRATVPQDNQTAAAEDNKRTKESVLGRVEKAPVPHQKYSLHCSRQKGAVRTETLRSHSRGHHSLLSEACVVLSAFHGHIALSDVKACLLFTLSLGTAARSDKWMSFRNCC